MKKHLLVAFLICWTVFGPFAALSLRPVVAFAVCGGSSPNLTAASAGRTDVNDCVTAAVDGDSIAVPSGTQTWSTPITITNKSISLVGAGIGSTVITGTGDGSLVWTTKATGGSPAGFSRLSGFTFKASVDGCTNQADQSAMVEVKGTSHKVRVDHVKFEGTNCGGLHAHGDVRGVIDHNTFENISCSLCHMLPIEHELWDSISSAATQNYGDGSWSVASTFGTENMLYVEDNTFTNTLGTNGQYFTNDFIGARTVYRFNTWTSAVWASHGTESGGRYRGFRGLELYRNAFNWGLAQWPSVAGLRGGTGFAFDNVATGLLNNVIDFNTYRRDTDGFNFWVFGSCGVYSVTSITRSGSTATVTHSGPDRMISSSGGSYHTIIGAAQSEYNGTFLMTKTSSTTFTYTVTGTPATPATGTITVQSAFDGNSDSTGYRCADQLGAGQSILLQGTEPGFTAPNPNPPVSLANALEPFYCWNNTDDGSLSACANVFSTDVIVNLRDYYNQNNSFNGTTQHGVGRGARASRPSSCTTGDAWFATDQGSWNTSTTETYSSTPGADGVLDKCTSTNTWTNGWYTPYTYPHPLVDGGGGDPPPDPPSPTEDDPAASFMAREF